MAITRKSLSTPQPVTIMPEPMKNLLVWRAPARSFKPRNREYYTTIAAIIFLLAVILIFLQEWMLIGVIVSLGFLAYVLSSVQPQEVENIITTKGIIIEGKRYDWNILYRFWFSQKWGNEILNIETRLAFPRRLMLLLGKTNKQKIQQVLEKYLINEKPSKTFIDKAALWLQKKVPLESE